MESFLQDPVEDDVVMNDNNNPDSSQEIKQEPQPQHPSAVENKEDSGPVDYLNQLDLLPMILELLEKVSNGVINPKDIHNEAGSIRVKLSKAKSSLKEIEGLDEGIDDRNRKIEELKYQVSRKKELIQQFRNIMNDDDEPTEEAVKQEENDDGEPMNVDD